MKKKIISILITVCIVFCAWLLEAGKAKEDGALVPGKVVTGGVRECQKVRRGETLLTLEDMKMEATVRADEECVIAEVIAQPGMEVDAKD